jgi:phosphoglycolate phosphatase
MTPPYKHAIWDWNGTLLNDTSLCVEVLNGLLRRRGRGPITEAIYRNHFGFPVIDFYHYLGFDTDSDSFDQVSHEFIGDYEMRWFQESELQPEASTVLSALTEMGMTHSVLSAAKQEALNTGIAHFGLSEYFIGLMGTDNIYAQGKVAQGQHWIKQLPWKPDEIVLIGDTLHDFEVAQAIGTHCVLIGHGHHTPERLAAAGVPVVQSLHELMQLFQNA